MRTLLIAEDQPLMREGIKRILSQRFPLVEFGEAATTTELLAALAAKRWDALIFNMLLASHGAMELLRQISHEHPQIPILALSNSAGPQSAVRALQHGASGCLTRNADPEELVRALRTLTSGGRHLSGPVAESLAASLSEREATRHERLSHRELEVMHLLLAGRTLKEIAASLSLSVKTVSTFHTRIREKLRVHTDVELVHYALEHNLADKAALAACLPVAPKIVPLTALRV